MFGDTEVDKAFGELVITLSCNRDGVMNAFGINGLKKCEPIDIVKAINWAEICAASDKMSHTARRIFGDMLIPLQSRLADLMSHTH